MSETTLDDLDRTLINRLQDGLPLVEEPYKAVAEELGIKTTELYRRIDHLLETRVLSRFGPMFDIEKMGGAFCLCAMAIPEEDWKKAVEQVNAFPEVAHNYQRQHKLNMWFVLGTDSKAGIEETAKRIEAITGYAVHCFPKEKEFFIGMRIAA